MDTATLKQRLAGAAEKAAPVAEKVSAAAAPKAAAATAAAKKAAEAAKPVVEQAAERVSEAAADVREHSPEWWEHLVDLVGDVVENVGERGRELASHIEPPQDVKRRRMLQGIGIFTGGFALGALVGFLAGRDKHSEPDLWEESYAPPAPVASAPSTTYGSEAKAVQEAKDDADTSEAAG